MASQRATDGWRIATTYDGLPCATDAKATVRNFAKDLRFTRWGNPPEASLKPDWQPRGGGTAGNDFARPVRIPVGLEMRMTLRDVRVVARTVAREDRNNVKLLHWEILKENPDGSCSELLVEPIPGPSPVPVFKALLLDKLGYTG